MRFRDNCIIKYITLCLDFDVSIIDLDKNVDKMSCHLPLK